MPFKFIDLFAGIGGFHAALSSLGGKCVYASEWDEDAARIYAQNWNLDPDGDITLAANDQTMDVPEHDVLAAGFPCQPFSKSGKQLGMDETRGTLFWNIAKIVEVRKPKLVLLENVQNLVGPRHVHEWDVIIRTLQSLGYRVSKSPLIVSPHLIRPEYGGRPQVRNRVFITATLKPLGHKEFSGQIQIPDLNKVMRNWDPSRWNLKRDLPLEKKSSLRDRTLFIDKSETLWIDAWDEFVQIIRSNSDNTKLPGFPIWAESWIEIEKLKIPRGTPQWKQNFLRKNAELFSENKSDLKKWLKRWRVLEEFPPSRRKFEWQAQDASSLWETLIHLRPSGIRAKKATYVPALVAITQTSIVANQKRRLSVREAARLQGFPDWFDFLDQNSGLSYKQLGNAVNVGAAYNVLRAQVLRDLDLLSDYHDLTRSILNSPESPDINLINHKQVVQKTSQKLSTKKQQVNLKLA